MSRRNSSSFRLRTPKSWLPRSAKLGVHQLEDRTVPTVLPPSAGVENQLVLPPTFHIVNSNGFLTGPQAGDPQALANAALTNYASQAGLLPADVLNPRMANAYSDGPGSMYHVYYQQTANGLMV